MLWDSVKGEWVDDGTGTLEAKKKTKKARVSKSKALTCNKHHVEGAEAEAGVVTVSDKPTPQVGLHSSAPPGMKLPVSFELGLGLDALTMSQGGLNLADLSSHLEDGGLTADFDACSQGNMFKSPLGSSIACAIEQMSPVWTKLPADMTIDEALDALIPSRSPGFKAPERHDFNLYTPELDVNSLLASGLFPEAPQDSHGESEKKPVPSSKSSTVKLLGLFRQPVQQYFQSEDSDSDDDNELL